MATHKLIFFSLAALSGFVSVYFIASLIESHQERYSTRKRVLSTHRIIYDYDQSSAPNGGVGGLVEKCFEVTNFSSESSRMLQHAKSNAEYLFQELRKVVPEKSLDGYGSHCWRESYSVKWDHNGQYYSGHIGNILSNGSLPRLYHSSKFVPTLNKEFPSGRFRADIVCLPKVYMPGFHKCGSTFLYSYITSLIAASHGIGRQLQAVKEPRFWVKLTPKIDVHYPSKRDIIGYLLNFAPGLHQIQEYRSNNSMLIDGTQNTFHSWPRFSAKEHDATNYCILPSVLPKLIPDSKFIVIMRNPASMLYSAFWYSCTASTDIPMSLQLKGPALFHASIKSNIHLFNQCMRDSSTPSLSQACELQHNYSSCILERKHFLSKCMLTVDRAKNAFPSQRCGRASLSNGMYAVAIEKWLSVIQRERFLFLYLEELVKTPISTAHDVLDFLSLNLDTATVQAAVRDVMSSGERNEQLSVDYKKNPALKMRDDTKLLLARFYQPFNTLLAQKLNKKLPW